jgi:hypothetical protein
MVISLMSDNPYGADSASEELAWRDLRAVWRPVAVLAVGLVLASAASSPIVRRADSQPRNRRVS